MSTATMPLSETIAATKLEIRRVLKADPQSIFDAWLTPESLQRWFMPGDMTVRSATVDARVGGAYRIEMEGATPDHPDPNHITAAEGIYTHIVPGKLLAFTWGGACSPNEETHVTIALNPVEGGTELTLIHERLLAPGSRERHEHGWKGCLDKLEAFVSRN